MADTIMPGTIMATTVTSTTVMSTMGMSTMGMSTMGMSTMGTSMMRTAMSITGTSMMRTAMPIKTMTTRPAPAAAATITARTNMVRTTMAPTITGTRTPGMASRPITPMAITTTLRTTTATTAMRMTTSRRTSMAPAAATATSMGEASPPQVSGKPEEAVAPPSGRAAPVLTSPDEAPADPATPACQTAADGGGGGRVGSSGATVRDRAASPAASQPTDPGVGGPEPRAVDIHAAGSGAAGGGASAACHPIDPGAGAAGPLAVHSGSAQAAASFAALGLLPLFAWLSPAFPVGAYAYSHTLEWAVEAGDIADEAGLAAFLSDLLALGFGRSDAILLAHAWRAAGDEAALAEVNDLAVALAPSAELRLETCQQGRSFLDAVRAAWPAPGLEAGAAALDGEVAYPVAVGLAAAAHGMALPATLDAFLLATAQNLVSAAIRLAPIGQTAGTRVVAGLAPRLRVLAAEAASLNLDDIGSATFRADLGSFRHETQYTRLFRS